MALPGQIAAADRGDTKPSVGDVFTRRLNHVVDATPAQWATFTVDVITTARSARMPHAELIELLDMLGIAGDDEPQAVAS